MRLRVKKDIDMLCGEFGFILTLVSLKDFKQEHNMVRFIFPLLPSLLFFLIIILVVDAVLKAC